MKRDYIEYLNDILISIDEIAEFIKGFTYERFFSDKKTTNAVIRSLEVMGEAAKKIPDSIRLKSSKIPWKRIAGMRDKLTHEYFGIDMEIVWKVSTEEIPPLKKYVLKLIKEIENQ
ncbi:MAG: DUF86 domain-containing protein [Candidatus Aminicenantes bacterium]|nr:DUF86 domain-containing protein [Candidatus Aminicenantes bacterium]